MTHQHFINLVSKLESQARRKPTAYKVKVRLLALLGNAYVGSILLILLALVAILVVSLVKFKSGIWGMKGLFIVGPFLYVVLICLWVKVGPPEGIGISARKAPELFAIIQELRRKLGAPRFHDVLITFDLNAAIVQLPRFGIFGWPRNYLLVGMPLLKSLTCEQFKSVLAHEFGHLAKGHGLESHSIYRQRLRWGQLMMVFQANESKGRFLFVPFLNWFVPYFTAFSFPLARTNEYEADRIAARLTSSGTFAEALTSLVVMDGYLTDRFWRAIDAEFGEQPQPSRNPYFEMDDAFATGLEKEAGQGWLGAAMARPTNCEDTHPALSERLAAIGKEPNFNPPAPGQAADTLLGSSLDPTTKALDARWKNIILAAWEQRHSEIQEGRRRLSELDEKRANGAGLTLQERCERAELTESIAKDAAGALSQWRALHESAPDDARVCLALGSRLLVHNDETGCNLVKRALRLDEFAIVKGCELLCQYYIRNGREAEYHAWNRLLIEEAAVLREAATERNRISAKDDFEPHGLPEDRLATLVAQLQAVPGLRSAYFIKKRVLLPDHPLYVLGYRVTPYHQSKTDVFERIQNSVQFPGDTFIIDLDGENYQLKRKFRRLRFSRILNPARGLGMSAMNVISTTIKKLFGFLAVLFGIGGLLLPYVVFTLGEKPFPGVELCVAFIFGLIMITVGFRWLRDPID
jgi:Zn-dependent protease with chaperone function